MYNEQLKKLRIEREITQEQIANIIGIERSHYAHYELGDRLMPIDYLNKVCNFYNISLDYMFNLTKTLNYNDNKKELDLLSSSERLKNFRKNQKLTQSKLANILNIANSLISDYEKGKRFISSHAIYTICKKYHISADYLLGKIDYKPKW